MNRAMHGTVTPSTCNSPTQANASSIYPATASSGAPCYQNTVNKKNGIELTKKGKLPKKMSNEEKNTKNKQK